MALIRGQRPRNRDTILKLIGVYGTLDPDLWESEIILVGLPKYNTNSNFHFVLTDTFIDCHVCTSPIQPLWYVYIVLSLQPPINHP